MKISLSKAMILFTVSLVGVSVSCSSNGGKSADEQRDTAIVQGELWLDTDSNRLNAHGAGMLYHDGTYYLYGEYKEGE